MIDATGPLQAPACQRDWVLSQSRFQHTSLAARRLPSRKACLGLSGISDLHGLDLRTAAVFVPFH